jgi:hypothetical protein
LISGMAISAVQICNCKAFSAVPPNDCTRKLCLSARKNASIAPPVLVHVGDCGRRQRPVIGQEHQELFILLIPILNASRETLPPPLAPSCRRRIAWNWLSKRALTPSVPWRDSCLHGRDESPPNA